MSEQQFLEILYTYRQRYNVLSKDPRVKLILLSGLRGERFGIRCGPFKMSIFV